MVENSDGLQLHYFFKDESHTIDSILRNECEKELLYLFKEIAETLELSIHLETEPTEEGGFKETWRFLGKNANQITLIISIATIVITRFPVENKELNRLQIENLKLDNEIKRQQLEKLNLDSLKEDKDLTDDKLKDSTNLVIKNYKISWRKSNLFKKLNSYPKVDFIEIQRFKNKSPVGPPRKIPKDNFQKFILNSDDLPDLELEKATIDVISPAIKSGKFMWKGFYGNEIINFEMNDSKFKTHVIKGNVHFSNTFSIKVDMNQIRKIDQNGNVKVTNTIINRVVATIENGIESEFLG
ncbi:hypothetical protein [Mucilaginibacter galii]|nr:hypothetical protein [Mucilaginibacter galii]